MPTTGTGRDRVVRVPSPSWPDALPPQAYVAPAPVTARLCRSPAPIAATPLNPATTAGAGRRVTVVPSPS